MAFYCMICNIEYSSKYSLKRHQNVRHNASFSGFACNKCDKKYTAKTSLLKHTRKCQATQKPSTKSIQIGGMSRHVNTSESTHQDQEENEKPPNTTNHSLESIIRSNWGAVKTYFKRRKVQDIFNFRLINQKLDLKTSLTNICLNKIQNQVKMNCSLGFILQHRVTQELRYFHSSINNTQIFSSPVRINSIEDLLSTLDDILELDLFEKAKLSRPDSSWGVVQVTNISFYLAKTNFPKVGSPVSIPNYIRKKKCIHTVSYDGNQKLTDNLCFFRCLYLKQNCKHDNASKKLCPILPNFASR